MHFPACVCVRSPWDTERGTHTHARDPVEFVFASLRLTIGPALPNLLLLVLDGAVRALVDDLWFDCDCGERGECVNS